MDANEIYKQVKTDWKAWDKIYRTPWPKSEKATQALMRKESVLWNKLDNSLEELYIRLGRPKMDYEKFSHMVFASFDSKDPKNAQAKKSMSALLRGVKPKLSCGKTKLPTQAQLFRGWFGKKKR